MQENYTKRKCHNNFDNTEILTLTKASKHNRLILMNELVKHHDLLADLVDG